MAITKIRKITDKPLSIYCDGTYCYVGTNKGRILRVTISGGATTVYATLRGGQITALGSDGTYLYAGDDRGRLTRITINATASLRVKVAQENLHSAIVALHHNTSTRYIGLANGQIASRA